MSLFDELGGEPALRAIVDAFVDRVFDDFMIGFHFRDANRARVKAKEYELAAEHLGAGVAYTGRALAAAHRPHRILGGQFERRLKILAEVLDERGAPAAVREHWLRHDRALAGQILNAGAGPCTPGTGTPLPSAEP